MQIQIFIAIIFEQINLMFSLWSRGSSKQKMHERSYLMFPLCSASARRPYPCLPVFIRGPLTRMRCNRKVTFICGLSG